MSDKPVKIMANLKISKPELEVQSVIYLPFEEVWQALMNCLSSILPVEGEIGNP